METSEIQSNVQILDQEASQLGNTISNLQSQARSYRNQAESCRQSARQILSSIYSEEDADRVREMSDRASQYMGQANAYEAQADNCETQIDGYRNQLRAYRTHYTDYRNMASHNMADLNLAIQQLLGLSGSSYGAQKMRTALETMKQRLNANANLVNLCEQRIRWVEQVCGSVGDQYTKVKRR